MKTFESHTNPNENKKLLSLEVHYLSKKQPCFEKPLNELEEKQVIKFPTELQIEAHMFFNATETKEGLSLKII